jgi:AraC family transcriptional regulator, transcriptional activator of pobA
MPPYALIPIYGEINECHEVTGFPVRSDMPDFHVFTLEETYPCPRMAMPPFRRGFYQVTYLDSTGGATMNFENEVLQETGSALIFSPPEQVMSWVCGGNERGFMLYFKPELWPDGGKSLEEAFPFFDSFAVSVLPVSPASRTLLQSQWKRLREIFHARLPHRRPQLAALTTALLYDCLTLYTESVRIDASFGTSPHLVTRFRQLVAQCFQHHCSVEDYARCLHVSADHLRATVKKHTGRTVREFVEERVMLEAKRLLAHTELTVGEVADHLQFSEPTHFTRFFKRRTQRTPLAFRFESGRTATAAVA